MKIQFAVPFKDLEENDIIENGSTLMLNKLVAPVMASQVEGVDVMKFYDWARSIYKGEELDLDRTDVETIKTFINTNKQLSVIAKGRLLDCLVPSATDVVAAV